MIASPTAAALAEAERRLAAAGVDEPRLEARILLEHCLGLGRAELYAQPERPLAPDELAAYRAFVARRAEREPLAYVVGHREFFGRDFLVDARVLVPRPETELLVEAALAALPEEGALLDLCTGSGCVAVTVALERPRARVVGADLSAEALALARENAQALGASVEWLQGDLYAPLPPEARFDVIAANPPYVPSPEVPALARELSHEPALALDGGRGGLEVSTRVVAGAPARLVPGGTLVVEMHESQRESLPRLCLAAGFERAEARRDLAGLWRYAVARMPG